MIGFRRGLSLIELLFTLTVLAIVLVLATPSLQNVVMNARLSLTTDALVSALDYARQTALSKNTTVSVCPLGTDAQCGVTWALGWMLVTEPNTVNATRLQANALPETYLTLSSDTPLVTFNARGMLTSNTHFTLCDKRGNSFATSINVLQTGFIEPSHTPGRAAWDGGALACQ